MAEECLVCGSPLEYLHESTDMACFLCGKREQSRTRCVNGHYVCNECHTRGLDSIVRACLEASSKDPVQIMETLMSLPFCHMHGPEHHVMVGAALLAAYRNAGGAVDLAGALGEMLRRGSGVPGGACGFWGACGAGISTGMFVSIVTGSTPLEKKSFGLAHKMTARALDAIGEIGGPRCCKRDSYLSLAAAVDFTGENLGVHMERSAITCSRSGLNGQCIGRRCPFFSPGSRAEPRAGGALLAPFRGI